MILIIFVYNKISKVYHKHVVNHKYHSKLMFRKEMRGKKTHFFCRECKVHYYFEIGSDIK